MKPTTDRLVDDYLEQLDSELADLPQLRRKEIVEEISEHITEALAASPSPDEAGVRTLPDRLGDPAEIASDARERFGAPLVTTAYLARRRRKPTAPAL